jgi:dihydropteroate synthase
MIQGPASILSACQRKWNFPRPTLIMGIVNVTPDSFYDGGEYATTIQAIEHGLKLAAEGADILDVGGESTRPGASPVSEAEELRRVLPVIESLAGQVKIPISTDTMKPAVARKAIQAGATIVNDVAAATASDAMAQLIAEFGAAYVCVHMQGTPDTMQRAPSYKDVIGEIGAFFQERQDWLHRRGVKPEQVIFDPGVGFGKKVEHNLQLLASLERFTELGRPVLLGVSRKAFISAVTGGEKDGRLAGSLACACRAAEAGVSIIRAHDVRETIQAVRMAEAILAQKQKK